jgi:hypothetical protein
VAVSFPGEYRKFVAGVADHLSKVIGRERVLYDGFYEAEFARPNLDTYLQNLYHDQSELVVVFLCKEYNKKEWTGVEWRAIRDLFKKKMDQSVMLIRFDDADVQGVFSIDGYVDVGDRKPSEIADLILERYERLQCDSRTERDKALDTVRFELSQEGQASSVNQVSASRSGVSDRRDLDLAQYTSQILRRTQLLRGDSNDRAKKFISELYVPADHLAQAFDEFLSSESACFLLIADSGFGKTCWACDTALGLTRTGRPALFYRAIDIENGISTAILDDARGRPLLPQNLQGDQQALFEVLGSKNVTVFVDGIDEIDEHVARRVIDDFVSRIDGSGAKLAVTCKSTSWEYIRQSSGTLLSEKAFRVNGVPGYRLQGYSQDEFFEMVRKHRDFYQFDGTFENAVLEDCKRSPFLLRVIFEVAATRGLSHLTYSNREYYNVYLAKALEPFGRDRIAAEQLLIQVAAASYELDSDVISLDEVAQRFGAANLLYLTRFFELNILLQEGSAESPRVAFYFSKIKDFLVAFRVLRLQELGAEAFRSHADRVVRGSARDVLELYYTLASDDHKRVVDGPLYDTALRYVSTYEAIVDEHFGAIRSAFSPYDESPEGADASAGLFALFDTAEREISYYGFRTAEPGEPRIVLSPASATSREQHRSLADIWGASVLQYRDCLGGFRGIDATSAVFHADLPDELDRITSAGLLDESLNRELMAERLLGIAVRYCSEYLEINEPFLTKTYLPLPLDRIETALLFGRALRVIRSDWMLSKAEQSEPKVDGGIRSYRCDIPEAELQRMRTTAMDIAARGELLDPVTWTSREDAAESFGLQDLLCLREMGLKKIEYALLTEWDFVPNSGSIRTVDGWRPQTLVNLLERIYTAFLAEYQTLVQQNFSTFCSEFPLFQRMPVKLFLILGEDSRPTGEIYECQNGEGTDNTASAVKGSDIKLDERRRLITHLGADYPVLSQRWVRPSFLLDPYVNSNGYLPFDLPWHKCALRKLVYGRLRADLRAAYSALAARYNVHIDASSLPFRE